jgi:hypothetical protein
MRAESKRQMIEKNGQCSWQIENPKSKGNALSFTNAAVNNIASYLRAPGLRSLLEVGLI